MTREEAMDITSDLINGYNQEEFNTEDGKYIPYNPDRVFKACEWILENA